MLEERRIFCRHQRLEHRLWNVLEVDRHTPFLAKFADQLTIAGVDAQWRLQLEVLELTDIGEPGSEVEGGTDDAQGRGGAKRYHQPHGRRK